MSADSHSEKKLGPLARISGYVTPLRRAELDKSLEVANQLLAELDGVPSATDQALARSAAIARLMVEKCTRVMLNKGFQTRRGDIKGVSGELRSWLRAEAALLSQLGIARRPEGEEAIDVSDPSRWRRPESLPDDLADDEDLDIEDPIADAADGQQRGEDGA